MNKIGKIEKQKGLKWGGGIRKREEGGEKGKMRNRRIKENFKSVPLAQWPSHRSWTTKEGWGIKEKCTHVCNV